MRIISVPGRSLAPPPRRTPPCSPPAGLQAVCAAVHIPVVAIGGVNARSILQLQGSGAAGAAVVSAIFGAPDITAACRDLRALADTMVQGGPPCRKEHL